MKRYLCSTIDHKSYLHPPNETWSVLAVVLGSLQKEFSNSGSVTEYDSSECVNEVGPVLRVEATSDPTVQHRQLASGSDKKVSRVQVPMPQIVFENLIDRMSESSY